MTTPFILLIEDDPTDEKLTRRAFAESGVECEMLVMRDRAETLSWPASASPLPALVLLDLKMARVDGLETLRRMRADEHARVVPVVVLTASREQEDVIESCARGANAYVRKPVDFAEFVDAAPIMARFWIDPNESAPPRSGGTR